jgi:hypothetical protein
LSPFKKELLGEQPFDMIAEMKINRIEFYHEEPSLSKKKSTGVLRKTNISNID